MENGYIYDRVRANVDLDAVKENIVMQQRLLKPGTKTCAVIKADGYGHGAVPIAKYVKDIVDYFAVATIDEATNLRLHNIDKPILILGFVRPENTFTAIRNDIRMCVFSKELAEKINEAAIDLGRPAKVHIKIDTGMNRIGFTPTNDSLEDIIQISRMEGIEIDGVFTHFYASDSDNLESAKSQFSVFSDFCKKIEVAGINIQIKHCSNSAAVQKLPEANLDMVRMGISIYGLYPSEYVHGLKLLPALSWISHISLVKTIHTGSTVGYGATYTANKDTIIATIPVGYADGYPRALSNKGYVLIGGKKAPIAGNVCMDQFMVDVTGIEDVKAGDKVVLVGEYGNESISIEELSNIAGPFNYEFACNIGKRVPRVYYAGGKEVSTKDYFYDRY